MKRSTPAAEDTGLATLVANALRKPGAPVITALPKRSATPSERKARPDG